jgi:predicted dehydrogenase
MESHNYRFNRGVVAMREAIDRGEIGTVREVGIRVALPVTDPAGRFGDPNLPSPIHSMPAGVIHDFMTHLTYLLRHLAGPAEFGRIAAAWSNHSQNPLFTWDDLDAILIGEGDAGPVHGRLRFDAGAGPDTFAIDVRGSEGWMETDLFQPYLRIVRPRPGGAQLSPIVNHLANGLGLIDQGVRNVARKIMQQTPYEGLHRMLDETYRALADGRPLPVTPDDMLGASELIDRLVDEKVRVLGSTSPGQPVSSVPMSSPRPWPGAIGWWPLSARPARRPTSARRSRRPGSICGPGGGWPSRWPGSTP